MNLLCMILPHKYGASGYCTRKGCFDRNPYHPRKPDGAQDRIDRLELAKFTQAPQAKSKPTPCDLYGHDFERCVCKRPDCTAMDPVCKRPGCTAVNPAQVRRKEPEQATGTYDDPAYMSPFHAFGAHPTFDADPTPLPPFPETPQASQLHESSYTPPEATTSHSDYSSGSSYSTSSDDSGTSYSDSSASSSSDSGGSCGCD